MLNKIIDISELPKLTESEKKEEKFIVCYCGLDFHFSFGVLLMIV